MVWIPVKTRFAVSGLLSFIPRVAITLLKAVQKEAARAMSSANIFYRLVENGKVLLSN